MNASGRRESFCEAEATGRKLEGFGELVDQKERDQVFE